MRNVVQGPSLTSLTAGLNRKADATVVRWCTRHDDHDFPANTGKPTFHIFSGGTHGAPSREATVEHTATLQ